MGIDKQGFVTASAGRPRVVGTGAFPDGFSGFGGENVTTESYDPEGARQVLEAAGWRDTDGDGIREKDGVKLTVRWLTYPSRQELPLLAESAQATPEGHRHGGGHQLHGQPPGVPGGHEQLGRVRLRHGHRPSGDPSISSPPAVCRG